MRALQLAFPQSARPAWYLRCFADDTQIPLSGCWLKLANVKTQVDSAKIRGEELKGGEKQHNNSRAKKSNNSALHRILTFLSSINKKHGTDHQTRL